MALRIKEIIKEKGMTVQTLADKMGINRRYPILPHNKYRVRPVR